MISNTGEILEETGSWRMSSASDNNGDCVEVTKVDDRIVVRDSKNRVPGLVLSFAHHGWRTLVAGL